MIAAASQCYLFQHDLHLTAVISESLEQMIGFASFQQFPYCCQALLLFQRRWLGVPPQFRVVGADVLVTQSFLYSVWLPSVYQSKVFG